MLEWGALEVVHRVHKFLIHQPNFSLWVRSCGHHHHTVPLGVTMVCMEVLFKEI